MTAQQLPEAAVEAAVNARYADRPELPLSDVEVRPMLQAAVAALSTNDLLSLAAERMGDEERETLAEHFAACIAGEFEETWTTAFPKPQRGRFEGLDMIAKVAASECLAALLPGEPRD